MEAIVLPVPSWDTFPSDFKEIFQSFRTEKVGWDLIVNQNFFVEKILPSGVVRELSEEEMNVYREPYLEPESRKPLWRWPNEIPIEGEPSDVNEAVLKYNAKLVEWGHSQTVVLRRAGSAPAEARRRMVRDQPQELDEHQPR